MPKAGRLSDWMWGFFVFALMVAYWPHVAGVATTPRWDVATFLVIIMFFGPVARDTTAHWLGLAPLCWMGLTILWNDGGHDGRLDGVEALFELMIGLMAFWMGSTLFDIRPVLVGAAIGIGVNSTFCIAQWFGWDGWQGLIQTREDSFAGLFYEKDRLAAATAMVTVGLVALPRLWILLPLLLPALWLAHSRAAWLAIGISLVVQVYRMTNPYVRQLKPFLAMLLVPVVVTIFVHFIANPDQSTLERLAIWHDTILNLNLFGHGLGSFREVFLQKAHFYDFGHWQHRPEAPHNELLWLAFEGGIPAIVLAGIFSIAVVYKSEANDGIGVLVCLAVLCMFAMPLHDPSTLVLGALYAGYVASCGARARELADTRRNAICAGMAAERNQRQYERFAGRSAVLPVPAAVSRRDGEKAGNLCTDRKMSGEEIHDSDIDRLKRYGSNW